MSTDRLRALGTYSVRELVEELKRRKDEIDDALALFAAPTDSAPRYARKSEAKAAYWAEWHEYKAANPNATLERWRKARKRNAR